jgi:hypothetical protein
MINPPRFLCGNSDSDAAAGYEVVECHCVLYIQTYLKNFKLRHAGALVLRLWKTGETQKISAHSPSGFDRRPSGPHLIAMITLPGHRFGRPEP